MFHDTHAHLDLLLQNIGLLPDKKSLNLDNPSSTFQEFSLDRSVIDKLIQNHDFIIHPTVNNANFTLAYQLLHSFSKIYFLLGSHPEIVTKDFSLSEYLDAQREIIIDIENSAEMSEKVIGIGEAGLDYHYTKDKTIHEKQIALFESQIALAIKLKLPLIIHSREAFEDIFQILKEYPEIHGHFLVHCFTEDIDTLRSVLDLGGLVAFGGVTTFKSAVELQKSVEYCPDQGFVLETDLPFLAPVPFRGETCMPEMISYTAQHIAKIRDTAESQIWHHSLQNTKKLFTRFL